MKEDFNILDELKKQEGKSGFKVPGNYFESFEDKMMDTIIAEEKPLAKKIVMVLKPLASLAAMFVFVALIYYSVPNFLPTNNQLALVSESEMSLDFLASRFDESELIDFIVEEDNPSLFEDLETNQNLLEGLSMEDVEDLVIF